jgi:hypothetical protein
MTIFSVTGHFCDKLIIHTIVPADYFMLGKYQEKQSDFWKVPVLLFSPANVELSGNRLCHFA